MSTTNVCAVMPSAVSSSTALASASSERSASTRSYSGPIFFAMARPIPPAPPVMTVSFFIRVFPSCKQFSPLSFYPPHASHHTRIATGNRHPPHDKYDGQHKSRRASAQRLLFSNQSSTVTAAIKESANLHRPRTIWFVDHHIINDIILDVDSVIRPFPFFQRLVWFKCFRAFEPFQDSLFHLVNQG